MRDNIFCVREDTTGHDQVSGQVSGGPRARGCLTMERGSAEFGVQLGEVGLRTQVHDFLTGTFSCLAFSPGDETKLVEATAKVSVTLIAELQGARLCA